MKHRLSLFIGFFVVSCFLFPQVTVKKATVQAEDPDQIVFKNGQAAIFFEDGGMWVKKIVDMSSRTKEMQFLDDTKKNISQIWMINFLNKQWNYPAEREALAKEKDLIVLKDGSTRYGQLVDFSSQRQVFEFKDDSPVHVSKIKRIYFCCTKLPQKLQEQLAAQKKDSPERESIRKIRKKIVK